MSYETQLQSRCFHASKMLFAGCKKYMSHVTLLQPRCFHARGCSQDLNDICPMKLSYNHVVFMQANAVRRMQMIYIPCNSVTTTLFSCKKGCSQDLNDICPMKLCYNHVIFMQERDSRRM